MGPGHFCPILRNYLSLQLSPDLAPIVLDLFLLDGENVVHSLLLRMLILNEKKILSFTDECQLMKYLKMEMLNDTYGTLM